MCVCVCVCVCVCGCAFLCVLLSTLLIYFSIRHIDKIYSFVSETNEINIKLIASLFAHHRSNLPVNKPIGIGNLKSFNKTIFIHMIAEKQADHSSCYF